MLAVVSDVRRASNQGGPAILPTFPASFAVRVEVSLLSASMDAERRGSMREHTAPSIDDRDKFASIT